MNTSANKKVICIKDIPSNIIEEAIFILKTEEIENKNKKMRLLREEIILKESEELIKEYSEKIIKNEIQEKENKMKNINDIKLKIVLITILMVCICYLISIII